LSGLESKTALGKPDVSKRISLKGCSILEEEVYVTWSELAKYRVHELKFNRNVVTISSFAPNVD
jgi:hypothetical protein